MMCVNTVTILGTVAYDADVQFDKHGNPFRYFTVKVENADKTSVDTVICQWFGKACENVFFYKGDTVLVQGRIQHSYDTLPDGTRSYTNYIFPTYVRVEKKEFEDDEYNPE